MSHLGEIYDAEIRSELVTVMIITAQIEAGRREIGNGRVVANDWLEPTIKACNLPFNDTRGELHYYQKIKEGLILALDRGIIPVEFTPYFIRAPPRIRALLMREPNDLG